MDAGAYLRRQGWRGDGHALSQSGNGIKKPLLISKKVDVLGVGLNKHAAVSDQWWMRAFDQGLKDLGTGKKSTLSTVREKGMHFGGLYGRFVKGETVQGTMEEKEREQKTEEEAVTGQKRRRGNEPEENASKKRKTASDDGESKPHEKSKKVKQMRKDLYGEETKAFLAEAVRRGLIAPNPTKSVAKHKLSSIHTEQAILQVFADASLTKAVDSTKTDKKGKLLREKQERALKQAAKRYLLDSLPPEQRQSFDEAEKSRQQRAAQKKQAKKAAVKEHAKQKKQRKENQSDVAATQANDNSEAVENGKVNDLAKNEDEIKLEGSAKNIKRIPSVGVVDRYPTKAEKKAKKRKACIGEEIGHSAPAAPAANLGFVVDTAGDETLAINPYSSDTSAITVRGSDGEVRWTGTSKEPVPLDPTIWEGVKSKTLPKPVREARRQWMREQREGRKPSGDKTAAPSSRGQRKMEQRENLVLSILRQSRNVQQDGTTDQAATVDGIENVPLVKVETKKGPFTQDEMGIARRVARRVLKQEKEKVEEAAKADGKKAKKAKKPRSSSR